MSPKDHMNINNEMITKLLQNLDASKTGGDDGITNMMLKMVSGSINAPLCRLYERIILQGTLTSQIAGNLGQDYCS
jgi:hypothetical protein